MKDFSSHISLNQLADLIEGRVSAEIRKQLEAHLALCDFCSGELTQIEHLIFLLRTDKSQDAPPYLLKQVKRLFHSRDKPKPESTNLRRHILALLRFDSLGLAPAFGVRSGDFSARQLLFNAEEYDIDLRVEPVNDLWAVNGQVLGSDLAQGRVMFYGPSGMSFTTLNQQSEFNLPPVLAGSYTLMISLTNLEIEIKTLQIGTQH